MIDDVYIYNRVFKEEGEVRRLMFQVPDGTKETGLIGQWTFNDGGKGGIVQDGSGLGNHGSMSGGVLFVSSSTKPVHLRKFDVKLEMQG